MQAEQRLGERLGDRLTLERVIGAGGMATVYEAVHRNGHRFAVKVLHAPLALSEKHRTRFRREGYAVNLIDHHGVVRIFDDGEARDGTPYLVLELLRGTSIGALLKREGRLPPEQALDLADQLLEVLISAHAAGVVHRDLKPDNLFLLEGGALRVLDFGIARVREAVAGATLHTQHGALLGTPAFMAQEQARGQWGLVDERTDLWAAGATLFTMLSGEPVHAGGTPNEQLGRAMALPARSLRTVRPDLPRAVIDVVDRALAYEPSQRWPSAAAMRAALSDARAGRHGDRTRRARSTLAALTACVALLGALAGSQGWVASGRATARGRSLSTEARPQDMAQTGQIHAARARATSHASDAITADVANGAIEASPAAPAARGGAAATSRSHGKRMLRTASSAEVDRRSPPGYVAPPPNPFATRH